MSFPPLNIRQPEKISICRCCLANGGCGGILKDISHFGNKEDSGDMLKDVFNIQVLPGIAPMKQYICERCTAKLSDASLFKQMVIENSNKYVEYIMNHGKDMNALRQSMEDIKEEYSKLHQSDDYNHDSVDDDEVLSNLKLETGKADATVVPPNKRSTFSKTKCKMKERLCSEDNTRPQRNKQITTKSSDYRGNGPILRENSLKLLENSTVSIFQWNKSRYRCFCCKEPFSDFTTLQTHTQTHHSLEDIRKKIITQQNRLVKAEISSLTCKICDTSLKTIDGLKQHLTDHGINITEHLLVPFVIESDLKCQICAEPFSLFRLLNIHMNKHFQKHVCHICGSGFSNLVFLNLHKTRSHREIKCIKCDMVFSSRTLKRHHDIHSHGVKFERKLRFPCPYCAERFVQENHRVQHLVEAHNSAKPEFACRCCFKTFITRSLMNNHVKVVHMKERVHECDVCGSCFYTKSDVTRHRFTHTGEKNFSCDICNNAFATRDSLRRHLKRTHQN